MTKIVADMYRWPRGGKGEEEGEGVEAGKEMDCEEEDKQCSDRDRWIGIPRFG